MTALEFMGEQFQIADKIGLMPLMRFAKVAKAGVDSDDLEGLAVMHDLIEQCLADDEWQRFQDCADKHRADGDELMAFVSKVFEVLSERPTSRPSDSSAGPDSTPSTSEGGLSLVEQAEALEPGRPDLAMGVLRSLESRSA